MEHGIDLEMSCTTNKEYHQSNSLVLEGKLGGGNKRILKNLVVLGLTFVLLFISFLSVVNLQSSLNAKGGLGAYSLASMYVGVTMSSLFLPTLMMKKLKCKATILVSMFGYFIYVGSQLFPNFYTLIPSGFILGICISPLWTAQSSYVSRIGEHYAFLTSRNAETVQQQFFGIFFLLNQSAYIWGNLILSFVLTDSDSETESLAANYGSKELNCGINYCPVPDLQTQPLNQSFPMSPNSKDKQVYTLIGIYLGCILAAALIFSCFVDSLKIYGENEEYELGKNRTTKQLLLATFNQMANPNQLLLIPLSLLFGISIGMYGVDFTVAYVSCAWGVSHLGHVMLVYGLSASLSSFCLGGLIQYTGRIFLFLLVSLLNVVAIVILLFWHPNSKEYYIYFVVAGLWGVTEGFWSPQLSALYSSLFPNNKEAAFSHIRLWQSVGFIIAYFNGTKLCMGTKLYIGIATVFVGTIGYLIVEFRTKLTK